MSKLLTSIVRTTVKKIIQPKLNSNVPVEKQRKFIEIVQGLMPVESGVELEKVNFSQCSALKLTPKETAKEKVKTGAILYLHGGAYVIGSANTHKNFASILAKRTRYTVYVLDYRLAPEHPFPAALEDSAEAFENIFRQHGGNVAICGDSAGGGLSLATAQFLRDQQSFKPKALVLMSPWLNLQCDNDSYKTKDNTDPMLTQSWLQTMADLYADNSELDQQYLSPAFDSMADLPSTLVQAGEDEILLSDSHELIKKLESQNVEHIYQEYKNMWHVFQLLSLLVDDAKMANIEICKFLNEKLYIKEENCPVIRG